MTEKDQKEVIKAAIKEWMDDRLKEFGWWSLKTLAVAGLTLLVYYYIQLRGYTFP